MKPVSKEKVQKLVSVQKEVKEPEKKIRSAKEVREAMYGNKE